MVSAADYQAAVPPHSLVAEQGVIDFAGGIGVTPLMPMLAALIKQNIFAATRLTASAGVEGGGPGRFLQMGCWGFCSVIWVAR